MHCYGVNVFSPVVTPLQARGRYAGAVRLGTPESQRRAHAVLTAAKLDQAICEALNAGDLPDDECVRLGRLLLSAGGAK
jgi:hypothetical protein